MVQTLAREDVEMVEPEIDHHLVELAGIFDRPGQPCLGRLFDNNSGALARGFHLFGIGLGVTRLTRLIFDKKLNRRHPQGVERGDL